MLSKQAASVLSLALAIISAGCSGGGSGGASGGGGPTSASLNLSGNCVNETGVYFLENVVSAGDESWRKHLSTEPVLVLKKDLNGNVVALTLDKRSWHLEEFPIQEITKSDCTYAGVDDESGDAMTFKAVQEGDRLKLGVKVTDAKGSLKRSGILTYVRVNDREQAKRRVREELQRLGSPSHRIDVLALEIDQLETERAKPAPSVAELKVDLGSNSNSAVAPENENIVRQAYVDKQLTIGLKSLRSTIRKNAKRACGFVGEISGYEAQAVDYLISAINNSYTDIWQRRQSVISSGRAMMLSDDPTAALARKYFEERGEAVGDIKVAYVHPSRFNELGSYSMVGGALAVYLVEKTTMSYSPKIDFTCAKDESKKFTATGKVLLAGLHRVSRAIAKKTIGAEQLVAVADRDWSSGRLNLMLNSLLVHEIRHAIDNNEMPEIFVDGAFESEKAKIFKALDRSGAARKAYRAVIKTKEYKDFVKRRSDELKAQHAEYPVRSLRAKVVSDHRNMFMAAYRDLYGYQKFQLEARGAYEGLRFYASLGLSDGEIAAIADEFSASVIAQIPDEQRKLFVDENGKLVDRYGPMPDLVKKFNEAMLEKARKELRLK